MTEEDTLVENVGFDLEDIMRRERDYAPWMAQVIVSISKDPAFGRLNWRLREEIETIAVAVE